MDFTFRSDALQLFYYNSESLKLNENLLFVSLPSKGDSVNFWVGYSFSHYCQFILLVYSFLLDIYIHLFKYFLKYMLLPHYEIYIFINSINWTIDILDCSFVSLNIYDKNFHDSMFSFLILVISKNFMRESSNSFLIS